MPRTHLATSPSLDHPPLITLPLSTLQHATALYAMSLQWYTSRDSVRVTGADGRARRQPPPRSSSEQGHTPWHSTPCLSLEVLTALNHCTVACLHLKRSQKGWQEQVRMHAGGWSKDWSWPCAFFVPSLRYRYRPDVRQPIRLDVILHQLSPQSCNLATIASVECYVSDIMCACNDGERRAWRQRLTLQRQEQLPPGHSDIHVTRP